MYASGTAAPKTATLARRVHDALERSPYLGAAQQLRVEEGDGRICLHGRVGSFFEKQMAQEVVRRLDGVEKVDNLLTVAWA